MRQRGLFPHIELTEEKLRDIVEPLYPRLWRIIRSPFDDLVRRRAEDSAFRILDEGESAQWLRPQIVEHARQVFDSDPEVKVQKRRQQLFLRFKDDVTIVPKKLRKNRGGSGLTFSSYDTQQNMALWQQRPVQGLPDLPRLIVGYEFVDEMTDINVWIAYPLGKFLRACVLIPDQVGSVIGIYRPSEEDTEADEDPGFWVKAKKKELERKKDET